MGYTRSWTPPTIPKRDDLTAWKDLFTDVDSCLTTAGLVHSSTAGQLDISAISSLPADDTYAGFIEYEFDDALQATAPVVIKLEFGCGIEGLYPVDASYCRTRTPRIKATVYFKGAEVGASYHPQGMHYAGSVTTQLTAAGTSLLCYSATDGWLGVVYGVGSRNVPAAYTYGAYVGSTLALFVQRTMDATGAITGDGLAVYAPNNTVSIGGNSAVTGKYLSLGMAAYLHTGASTVNDNRTAPRVGRPGFTSSPTEVLIEPVYYPSAPPRQFPFLVTYLGTDIAAGTEFDFQPCVGPVRNFKAIGHNNFGIAPDSVDNNTAGFAMLFE